MMKRIITRSNIVFLWMIVVTLVILFTLRENSKRIHENHGHIVAESRLLHELSEIRLQDNNKIQATDIKICRKFSGKIRDLINGSNKELPRTIKLLFPNLNDHDRYELVRKFRAQSRRGLQQFSDKKCFDLPSTTLKKKS